MIYPMAAMALLSMLLAINLLITRVRLVKSGAMKPAYYKVMKGEPVEQELKASNAFRNQFQVPVLFYTAGLLSIVYGLESTSMLLIAWLYVAARVSHALIHITYNHVMQRLAVFMVSNVLLILFWAGLLAGVN